MLGLSPQLPIQMCYNEHTDAYVIDGSMRYEPYHGYP